MKTLLNLLIIVLFSCTLNAQEIGLNIGNIAPEIKLPNENGDTISLHSLGGKLVLIDFWASWCGPCRKENPTVVNAYNKYKDKTFKGGKQFTIYAVSLDQNENSWKKGIKDDGLVWTNVSDLKAWKSEAAKLYNIRSIPSNLLIDGNGIIIAKDLRGKDLASNLEKYVIVDPLLDFESDLNNLLLKFPLLKDDKRYINKTKDLKKIEKSLMELSKQLKNLKNDSK